MCYLCIAVALALSLGAAPRPSQESEALRIVRTASLFVRDSLSSPSGRGLLIDSEILAGDRQVADQLAQELGAARGRMADVLHCEPPSPALGLQCTISGRVTILAFDKPEIRANSARVGVEATYQATDGRIKYLFMELALTRTAPGSWKVDKVLRKTMS